MAKASAPALTPVQITPRHATCTSTKGTAEGYRMSEPTGASGSDRACGGISSWVMESHVQAACDRLMAAPCRQAKVAGFSPRRNDPDRERQTTKHFVGPRSSRRFSGQVDRLFQRVPHMGLLDENENDDDNGRRKHQPVTPANAPMA